MTLYSSKYGLLHGAGVSDEILSQSVSHERVCPVDAFFSTSANEREHDFNATGHSHGHGHGHSTECSFRSSDFVYAVFAMSVLTTLTCTYFVIAECAWNHIAKLDLTDVSDVALNASRGDTALYDRHEYNGTLVGIHISLQDPSARLPGIACANRIEGVVRGGSSLSQVKSGTPHISINRFVIFEQQENRSFLSGHYTDDRV
jgi:hypothetical protein